MPWVTNVTRCNKSHNVAFLSLHIAPGVLITDRHLEFSDVVSRLHSEGISLRSAYFKEPTLEDVFIRITGKELRA